LDKSWPRRTFALPSSCYAYLNIYLSGVAGAHIHRAWRKDKFMHFARDNCTSAEVRSSFALPEEMRFFRRWKTALYSLFVSVSVHDSPFPATESKLSSFLKSLQFDDVVELNEKSEQDNTICNKFLFYIFIFILSFLIFNQGWVVIS